MTDIRLTDTRDKRRHYSYWEMLAFEVGVEDGSYLRHVTNIASRIEKLKERKKNLQDMAEDLPGFWSYSHVEGMQQAIAQACAMLDESIKAYKEYLANYALLKTAADKALVTAHNHSNYCFKADQWYSHNKAINGPTDISAAERSLRKTTNPYVTCPTCNHYHLYQHRGWHINLKAGDSEVVANIPEAAR